MQTRNRQSDNNFLRQTEGLMISWRPMWIPLTRILTTPISAVATFRIRAYPI